MKLLNFFYFNRFDLVWGVGPKAGLLSMTASKFTNIKNRLFIFQGEVWASKKGFYRHILKFMDFLTARFATHLLAVSHSECSFLKNQLIVNSKKINVLGPGSICGVRIQKLTQDRQKLRKIYNIPSDAIVILFIGRIHPDKGILDLGHAFYKLKLIYSNIYLMIVGPDEGALLKLTKQLIDIKDFLKVQNFTSDTQKFYQLADIYCLPSYREGFPISILEAQANSLSIVTSDIYGTRDCIENGINGLRFKAGSVNDLYEKLEQLINNDELRKSLGVNGRNRVKKLFNKKEIINNYVNYINKLID